MSDDRAHGKSQRALDPDASSCGREPIHIPGAIQPSGALLAVLADGLLISHASANLADVLGCCATSVLGRTLRDVVGEAACQALQPMMSQEDACLRQVHAMAGPDGGQLVLQSHRRGRHICIDIEPAYAASPAPDITVLQAMLETFKYAATCETLCQMAVHTLKTLVGYDRVLAYRFNAGGHGEVIAEARAEEHTPYLGLHYPASDIPPQARRLYLSKRVGMVADARYDPVPLLADPALSDGTPLDLTHSALRSVSPIHRQYMRNMGTAASLTIRLAHIPGLDEQNLWGLLVCHHDTPRVAGPEIRAVADMIGQVASLSLATLIETTAVARRADRSERLRVLVDRLGASLPLPQLLTAAAGELLGLVDATGAIICIGGAITCLRQTPSPAVARQLVAALQAVADGSVLAVDDVGRRYPELADCVASASGALMLPIGQGGGDAILWLRPELPRIVTWGGHPTAHVAAYTGTGQISPRTSFAAWEERISGCCDAWTEADLSIVREFRGTVETITMQATKAELMQVMASEARHRDTAEVASDWTWEIDAALEMTFLSKRFGDTSGIPWAAVSGLTFADLVTVGFDAAGMAELLAIIEARAVFQDVVYEVRPTNGKSRFWRMSGKPFFDPNSGGFAGYRGNGTDVTAAIEHEAVLTAALRRAEAAERQAQAAHTRLIDAIEAIPDGFVLHDAEDRLVLCNKRYGEVYGLSQDLMTPGKTFEDMLRISVEQNCYVFKGQTADEWVKERLRRHQELDNTDYSQQLQDGRWLQVKERRTSDGGIVGIRVDVTEARQQEALEWDRKRAAAELKAAHLMQLSLLPSTHLQNEIMAKSGFDIASRAASCSELGGDLWGISDLDHGRVGVFVVDFAGHGTAAALNTFRLHTLVHEFRTVLLEPARFLKLLNQRLTALLQPGAYATMFYAVIDPNQDCITYAAAGAPPPLIRPGLGAPLCSLDSAGVPLGIIPDADYDERRAHFTAGGLLFLYSDMLTDFTDEAGCRAAPSAAFDMLLGCDGETTAEGVVSRVCAPFLDQQSRPLTDDLTAVCIIRH